MKSTHLAILACISIWLSSCGTLFFGTREKIVVNKGIPGARLKIDGIAVDSSAAAVCTLSVSKKKLNPTLEVSKDGFQTQAFELKRTKRKGSGKVKFLEWGIGGALLFTGANIAMINSVQPPSKAVAVEPFLLPGGALVTLGIIDGILKSNKSFSHKNLSFDAIPVPERAAAADERVFNCSSINIRIKMGEEIGSSYLYQKGAYVKKNVETLSESTIGNFVDLQNLVNTGLDERGYKVPGMNDKFNVENKRARYLINGEITELKLDNYSSFSLASISVDRRCQLTILWSVFDSKTNAVVLEKKVTAYLWRNDNNVLKVVYNTFTACVNKLLASDDWKKMNDVKPAAIAPANTTMDPIVLPAAVPASKISDALEGAVTIVFYGGHGSGFIVSRDGYILTNHHVVGADKDVEVVLNNGLRLRAEVSRANKETDVALLKLPGQGFKPMVLNKSGVTVGDEVVAVGTPGSVDLGQSISKGIMSGKRESEGRVYIQTDVSISPGNSGGPLLNNKHEVVGIITSKLIGKGIEGVGFAIPIQDALKSVNVSVAQ